MDCGQTKLRLGELLDGELDADARRAVEQHLELCPDCRGEYDAQRSIASTLASPPDVSVPSGLWAAIEERLEQVPGPLGPPRVARRVFFPLLSWRPLATAAAVLLAVGLGWLTWNAPWETTARAAQIDFRPLLEQADGDIEAGINALLQAYGGRAISRAEAAQRMKVRIAAPDELPAGLRLKSLHLLRLNKRHDALAFYFAGPRGQLLLLQCPPGMQKDYGNQECLPCRVGTRTGHIVRVGLLRLLHFDSDNVCVCVVSTLDEDGDLPAALNAVRIEF